jgi:hypothetical protein
MSRRPLNTDPVLMIAGEYPLAEPVSGQRIDIVGARTRGAQSRLDLLDLAGARGALVEVRGIYGDLILALGARRCHVPADLARAIRVIDTVVR